MGPSAPAGQSVVTTTLARASELQRYVLRGSLENTQSAGVVWQQWRSRAPSGGRSSPELANSDLVTVANRGAESQRRLRLASRASWWMWSWLAGGLASRSLAMPALL